MLWGGPTPGRARARGTGACLPDEVVRAVVLEDSLCLLHGLWVRGAEACLPDPKQGVELRPGKAQGQLAAETGRVCARARVCVCALDTHNMYVSSNKMNKIRALITSVCVCV